MRRRAAILTAAAVALAAAGTDGSDRDPAGYAVRLRLRPAPGGPVQRVALPAAALVALRNADGSDLRVFDGRGRAVPIARADPATNLRQDLLPVLPLLGARDTSGGARISVRLDHEGRARVAEVEGAGARTDQAVGDDAAQVGALVDARGVSGTAEALVIDVELPAGQPVHFAVEASGDLANWRRLGERVLYRAPGTPAVGEAIPLGSADLAGNYLRIGWRADSRLLSPVAVRRASLTSRADGGGAEVAVEAALPAPAPHAIDFAVPFATPLSAVRIALAPGEPPLPVRVLGRNAGEEPWRPLGEGVAAPGGTRIALDGAAVRAMRLEADRRTAGFARTPAFSFAFPRREVLFVAAGPPPFTLAAGREGAADVFLPSASVAGGREAPPMATVESRAAPRLTLSPPDEAGALRRRALLWAILLGAVALLGGMTWLLWRRNRAH